MGKIGLYKHRVAPRVADLALDSVTGVACAPGDDNLCSLGRETDRRGAADPAG